MAIWCSVNDQQSGGLGVNLHRLQDGTVTPHLINYDYDAEHDAVPPIPGLELSQVRIDAGRYTIVVFPPDGEAHR